MPKDDRTEDGNDWSPWHGMSLSLNQHEPEVRTAWSIHRALWIRVGFESLNEGGMLRTTFLPTSTGQISLDMFLVRHGIYHQSTARRIHTSRRGDRRRSGDASRCWCEPFQISPFPHRPQIAKLGIGPKWKANIPDGRVVNHRLILKWKNFGDRFGG